MTAALSYIAAASSAATLYLFGHLVVADVIAVRRARRAEG